MSELIRSPKKTKWSHNCGGYKTLNSSSTTYYFQYYPNNNLWSNAITSSPPTSISYSDIYSAEWIAPADGTLTRMDILVRASGTIDDCQFYVYRGTPLGQMTSLTLTQIAASGACGIIGLLNTYSHQADISGATFSKGDALYVMLKKETSTGSTSHYFSVNISGEFD